jgi:hypothetical protein
VNFPTQGNDRSLADGTGRHLCGSGWSSQDQSQDAVGSSCSRCLSRWSGHQRCQWKACGKYSSQCKTRMGAHFRLPTFTSTPLSVSLMFPSPPYDQSSSASLDRFGQQAPAARPFQACASPDHLLHEGEHLP